jgi:hypothetical protein
MRSEQSTDEARSCDNRSSRRSGVSRRVHATGSKPGCRTITLLRRDERVSDSGTKLDLVLDAFHVFNRQNMNEVTSAYGRVTLDSGGAFLHTTERRILGDRALTGRLRRRCSIEVAPGPKPLFGTPSALFNPRQLPGLRKICVLTRVPRHPRSKIEFTDPVLCRIYSVPRSASWARDLPVLCCLTSYI